MNAISIIGICVGVCTLIGVMIKIGKWIQKRHSFEEVTGKAIDRIDTSVEKINENISNIKTNVAVLAAGKSVDISQSPTYLNDLGKSISEEIKGKEWAKSIANRHIKEFENVQPYDVQGFAFRYVQKEFKPSEEMLARMKNSAWENGIPIDLILRVLSLELRDAMLDLLGMEAPEEHPEH